MEVRAELLSELGVRNTATSQSAYIQHRARMGESVRYLLACGGIFIDEPIGWAGTKHSYGQHDPEPLLELDIPWFEEVASITPAL
jgi:hypothetical protein